jgi:hypothetical protein
MTALAGNRPGVARNDTDLPDPLAHDADRFAGNDVESILQLAPCRSAS